MMLLSHRFVKDSCCAFIIVSFISVCFFFNDTATTDIYTLSLHDALPICGDRKVRLTRVRVGRHPVGQALRGRVGRSEEHTSELQSLRHLVCRLLLEKKKKPIGSRTPTCDRSMTTPQAR